MYVIICEASNEVLCADTTFVDCRNAALFHPSVYADYREADRKKRELEALDEEGNLQLDVIELQALGNFCLGHSAFE